MFRNPSGVLGSAAIGRRFNWLIVGTLGLALMPFACRNESGGVPRPPSPAASKTAPPSPSSPALPPDHPPLTAARPAAGSTAGPLQMEDVDISGVRFTDARLTLTGISTPIPEGWVREDVGMNPQTPGLSRKAQFRLPKADNDAEDALVAITHFPGMKGMDEANLRRWYAMFRQPDGRPTVAVVRKAVYQVGQVSVTLVDIPGTMQTGRRMGGRSEPKENYRMLAAIVDHAKGPHFVKVTGPADVIERWKPSVVAFLKRFTVNP